MTVRGHKQICHQSSLVTLTPSPIAVFVGRWEGQMSLVIPDLGARYSRRAQVVEINTFLCLHTTPSTAGASQFIGGVAPRSSPPPRHAPMHCLVSGTKKAARQTRNSCRQPFPSLARLE